MRPILATVIYCNVTGTVSFLDLGFVIPPTPPPLYNPLQPFTITKNDGHFDILFGMFNTGKDFVILNCLILASRLFIGSRWSGTN